ncbi:unnamed protein product [Onchocerca ochengi]|uniref:Secreted protein n=1 Tax=Onchocerca ochengi TaxID=42157 RepID=A0A182E6Q6_ONCOC|nr:unnamed protein product [Onchocerca ochengi]
MERIILLFQFLSCISTTSTIIVLPGQIPYWAGGAATNSVTRNRLFGNDQQPRDLGSFGLSGFGGLQVIQIPFDNIVSSNPFPCTPCVICTPQSASANCMSVTKPAPSSGEFCCCCTPVTGSAVRGASAKKSNPDPAK